MSDTTPTPISEGSENIGSSLVDQFLNHSLPFQQEADTTPVETPAAGLETPAASNEPPPPDDETFEQQAARMGWTNNTQPATPTTTQPANQLDALPTFKTVQALQLGTQRDFNGLTPAERKIFGAMSKEGYAILRPIYDQFKKIDSEHEARAAKEAEQQRLIDELKGKEFYGLPDAWKLDPEIQPKLAGVENLANEANHWQNQLIAIDKGEKVQLIYVDPATGKPYLGEPEDPQPHHRAIITRAMQDAITKHSALNNEVQSHVQNFKARYSGWDNQVKTVNEQVFGKFSDKLKPHFAKMSESWPAAMRSQPIYEYATNATIMLQLLMSENAALKKSAQVKTVNQPARASASPSTTAAGSASAGRTPAESIKRMAAMTGMALPKEFAAAG